MASLDSIKELYNSLEMYNITLNRIVLAEDDPKKISVAIQSFAKITADEMPLLMYDETVTRNGKEGFLLTNKNIYVGNTCETPFAIDLSSITSVVAKPKLISSVIIVNDIKIDASGLLKKDLLLVADFLQKVIPLAMQVEKPKEKPVEVKKKKETTQNNDTKSLEKKAEAQKENTAPKAVNNPPKAEEKPEIKIEGDFDALLAKWKDIFTRDIKWEKYEGFFEEDCDFYHNSGIKNRYKDGDKSLMFASGSARVTLIESRMYRTDEVSYKDEDGYSYTLIYKPDSSKKSLCLAWYLTERRKFPNGNKSYYTINVAFYSDSGKKEGKTSIKVKTAYMKPQFESIFDLLGQMKDESTSFINKLKLADKEFIDRQNHKTDDDFDSL